MSKVITRIFGGLGNQLFCYAAARRLALANNVDLVLDAVSGFERDYIYQRTYQLDHFNIPCDKASAFERLAPFSRIRRTLKRRWNQQKPFELRGYIQQEGLDFDPRLLQVVPKGTVHLEGYWQSEGYFKDIEATIRQDLKITPPIDPVNAAMEAQIGGKTAVAVHVRFFDEPQSGETHNASGDYYTRAIEKMESLVPDAHYFIFSDKPEAARARIPAPDERLTLVSHNLGDENAYADLWLMSRCRHFITANSTFSWWGAWLGTEPAKIVIAPDLRLEGKTAWGFKGLLPGEWMKL